MPRQVLNKEEGFPWMYVIILSLIIIFLLFQNINLATKTSLLRERAKSVDESLEKEESKQEALIKKAEQDDSSLFNESMLRDKGMYKRKGEVVVYISDASGTVTSTNNQRNGSNFFGSILSFFQNIFK